MTPLNERGNILFLILLAIVLFAALSYAITSSMRGGGKSGDSESASAAATDIINYATLIENTVTRLRLVNGTNWDVIDFGNQYYHWTPEGSTTLRGNNPNCITANRPNCAVFTYRGGQVPARDLSQYSYMSRFMTSGYPYPGEAHFHAHYIDKIGTTTSPSILMYIVDVKDEICDAINQQLGLPLAKTQPQISWNILGDREYYIAATNYANRLPSTATAYSGQPTFCVNSSYFGNVFVHLIIQR